MGFLRRVHGVTLRDKVRSCEIRKALNVEPLLRTERSQLRWFGHVPRMSQETLLATPTGKRPRGRALITFVTWSGPILVCSQGRWNSGRAGGGSKKLEQ